MERIAWGKKLSPEELESVKWIANDLQIGQNTLDGTSLLMTCMAWESGRTFSPHVLNKAGSGATGLIQFMPDTAIHLGTTVAKLAKMTVIQQLNYVWKYFAPWKGQLKTLGDLYMAILWPAGVGKPESYPLWTKSGKPTTFRQNSGLDTNKDGVIVKAEATAKLTAMLVEGLKDSNASTLNARAQGLLGIHVNLGGVGNVLGDVAKGVIKTAANTATGGMLAPVIDNAVDKVGADVFNHGEDANRGWKGNPDKVITYEQGYGPGDGDNRFVNEQEPPAATSYTLPPATPEAAPVVVETTVEEQTKAVVLSKAVGGWQGNLLGILTIFASLMAVPDFNKAFTAFLYGLGHGESAWGAIPALIGAALIAYKHKPPTP